MSVNDTPYIRGMPKRAPGLPAPPVITPMLASSIDVPPASDDWIHEAKIDGHRAIVTVVAGATEIRSRNGRDVTTLYPAVAIAAGKLGRDVVVDGELAVAGDDGITRLGLLEEHRRPAPSRVVLFAFDLLWIAGEDLRRLPAVDRKGALAQLLPQAHANLIPVPHASASPPRPRAA